MCSPCLNGETFKPFVGDGACIPVTECGTREVESIPATRSSDRLCVAASSSDKEGGSKKTTAGIVVGVVVVLLIGRHYFFLCNFCMPW